VEYDDSISALLETAFFREKKDSVDFTIGAVGRRFRVDRNPTPSSQTPEYIQTNIMSKMRRAVCRMPRTASEQKEASAPRTKQAAAAPVAKTEIKTNINTGNVKQLPSCVDESTAFQKPTQAKVQQQGECPICKVEFSSESFGDVVQLGRCIYTYILKHLSFLFLFPLCCFGFCCEVVVSILIWSFFCCQTQTFCFFVPLNIF
jgi:hypothetical protein